MVDSKSPPVSSQPDLRAAGKSLREKLSPQEKQLASEKIAANVFASNRFLGANNIAIYLPMQSEADTWPIIRRAWQQKKRIFAPIIQENFTLLFSELHEDTQYLTNKMGLKEPQGGEFLPANSLDLVLAPLVAFDSSGYRIGMGGGYYDRTFAFHAGASLENPTLLSGIAFECQRVHEIVPNRWDIRLSRVFTELG
jgi:5-formyltetrahydrofolate cyclo-ligase